MTPNCRMRPTVKVLGIDPGLTGALAWLDLTGRLLEVRDMPAMGGEVHALDLLADPEISAARIAAAVLEWPGVMPHDGKAQCRSMGMTLGTLTAVLAARSVPTFRTPPGTWKRALNLNADKDRSRALAIRQWPDHATAFARKKDDGRAEAALLAWWWLTRGAGANLGASA